jgi:hypothetical protein
MKTRSGFVSNSSSSSFIVIDESSDYESIPYWAKVDTLVVDINFGYTDFGWGPERVDSIDDRIMFAYIQILYSQKCQNDENLYDDARNGLKLLAPRNTWRDMLDEVIREFTGIKEIVWKDTISPSVKKGEGYYDYRETAYIDHQSAFPETTENCRMFKDKETLKRFIFGRGSFVYLDNDNH